MDLLLGNPELRAGWIPGRWEFPAHSLHLIAKATYDLRPGAAAQPSAEPLDLAGDVHHDDDPEASLYYESDFAYHKPRADLLLVGSCHVPGRRPTERCDVEFAVGGWSKRVRVTGERRWVLPFGPLSPASPAEPFSRIPLRWENAAGGGRSRWNPVGRGRRREHDAEGRLLRPLPNLTAPGRPAWTPWSTAPPAGFGPVARTWKPRTRRLGRYRRRWRRTRFPWFPENFDWQHFNAAPPDQRWPGYLRGDEPLRLQNLHPEHPRYESALPGVRVRCVLREVGDGTLREVPLRLDTLWVDAEKEKLVLVWRGITGVASPEIEELDRAFFFAEPLDAPPAANEVVAARMQEVELEQYGGGDEPAPPESPPERPDVFGELAAVERELAALLAAVGRPDEVASGAPPPRAERLEAIRARLLADFADSPEVVERLRGWQAAPPPLSEELEQQLAELGVEMPADEPRGEGPTRDAVARRAAAGESLAEEDLSGLDLTGLALAGADLRGARLDATLLRGADLSGTDLRGASLARADLGEARLAGARLEQADLTEAILAGADAREACFDESSADRVDASGLRAAGASLLRADWVSAQLSGADLSGATLDEADLSASRLDGADLTEARLVAVTLEGAIGERLVAARADLTGLRAGGGTRLPGARLEGCAAADSTWEGADLGGASLAGADLSRADFTACALAEADLSRCDAPGARFDRADLRGSRLVHLNLFRGSFERADLRGADLRGANLYEVEFLDAERENTNLRGANVRMTKLASR